MNVTLSKLFVLLLLASGSFTFAQKKSELKAHVLSLVARSDDQVYDDPEVSLELAKEAHQIARELKNDSLIAVTLNRIGSAHWSLGNQIQALEKTQESLQIAESRRYEQMMAKNYGNIGNIYGAAGLDLDAIGYYKSELRIQTKLNTPFRLFTINNNIGKAFLAIESYDSAHFYLNSAAKYLDDSFIHLHSIFYANLSEAYFQQGEYEMTDSLLTITLKNAEQFESKRGIILGNQLKAEIELIKGNNAEALQRAKLAVKEAELSKVKELIYVTHKTLSNCYAALGDYQNAYKHDRLYENFLDSIQNVSTVSELELLSYYQRLFRMRVLEERNNLNKEVAEQRQFIIYGLVFIIVIALVLISMVILRGKKIRKQAKKLGELNAFKSKIFAIVSHDLKSPIQSVSSALELFHSQLISKEEIEKHLPEIKSKTSRLLDLLNNIFQWAEGQMEGDLFNKEKFPLVQIFQDLETELLDRLENKNIKLEYDNNLSVKLISDPGIVRIVLRNLIVNAIKFSHQNSIIRINVFRTKKEVIVEVVDEGIGIPTELMGGLFTMELGSSDGTSGEKGNGLGLALCFDFVKGLGGKIEAESQEGKGSTFRVHFLGHSDA